METEYLLAYIKGDNSHKDEIEAWAKKDRANEEELKKLSLALYASRLKGSEGDYDSSRAWARLKIRLFIWRLRPLLRVAAAIALFAAGALFMYIASPISADDGQITLSSNNDKKVQVTLPDGTLAYLNSRSSITFPSALKTAPERRIKLVGEAYFEAVHDSERPLIVDTEAGVEVTDLGTRFNVQAFEGDTVVQVALLEGKLRTEVLRDWGISHTNVLLPGDHFRFNTRSGDISLVNSSTVSGIEWMDNKLIFADTPLAEVVRELSHAMGVSFRIDPSLSGMRFSGTFENRDADTILSYIEQTCGVRSSRSSGVIVLSKK